MTCPKCNWNIPKNDYRVSMDNLVIEIPKTHNKQDRVYFPLRTDTKLVNGLYQWTETHFCPLCLQEFNISMT